jgi:integrase
MPRPQLPVGTWGAIRREQAGPRSWRARARFRDYDGVTRDVEASGKTGPAAENALRTKLRDRSTPNNDDITPDTKIDRLADLWLDDMKAGDDAVPQTIDRYTDAIRIVIKPALGKLRIREASAGRLDRCLKPLSQKHPAKAKLAKTVLGQMLAMAIRHDALTNNPIRGVGRLHKSERTVKALTDEDLDAVRAAIRGWQADSGASGPPRSDDLADIVDLLLATGARIGEVLAIRWSDLDLDATPASLTISGTLVYVKGKGLFRQAWTKSNAGYRTIFLPKFAVDMLLRRQASAVHNVHDAVFCSRKGTWRYPNNVRRQWRQARKDTNLEWVIPHTFRKTVATVIDREATTKAATAQLGHSSEEMTNTYYIEKARVAPDNSDLLETLGART